MITRSRVGRRKMSRTSLRRSLKRSTPNLISTPPDKEDLKAEVQDLQTEVAKGEEANESFLERRLRNIKRMAPDILETIATTFARSTGWSGYGDSQGDDQSQSRRVGESLSGKSKRPARIDDGLAVLYLQCHPERSEGSLRQSKRFLASLGMTHHRTPPRRSIPTARESAAGRLPRPAPRIRSLPAADRN